jgi:hypothetical protein
MIRMKYVMNIKELKKILAIKHTMRAKRATVAVGYTARYAVYQHENLQYNHTVGEAKFLEKPVRMEAHRLTDEFRTRLFAGESLVTALFKTGLLLKELSLPLVPVDTGFLRESAFVEVEKVEH